MLKFKVNKKYAFRRMGCFLISFFSIFQITTSIMYFSLPLLSFPCQWWFSSLMTVIYAISFLIIIASAINNKREVSTYMAIKLRSWLAAQQLLFTEKTLKFPISCHPDIIRNGLPFHSLLCQCQAPTSMNSHSIYKCTSLFLPHFSHTCTPRATAPTVISSASYSLLTMGAQ